MQTKDEIIASLTKERNDARLAVKMHLRTVELQQGCLHGTAEKLTECRHCGFYVALNRAPADSTAQPEQAKPPEGFHLVWVATDAATHIKGFHVGMEMVSIARGFVRKLDLRGCTVLAKEQAKPTDLQEIELYRMQMAAISSAALGYCTADKPILPEYKTLALADVQAIYAKYAALYEAAQQQPVAVPARELTDHLIYTFWVYRDCMDAIRAGDMRAQFISAARDLIAYLTAPHGESDKTVGSDHG